MVDTKKNARLNQIALMANKYPTVFIMNRREDGGCRSITLRH